MSLACGWSCSIAPKVSVFDIYWEGLSMKHMGPTWHIGGWKLHPATGSSATRQGPGRCFEQGWTWRQGCHTVWEQNQYSTRFRSTTRPTWWCISTFFCGGRLCNRKSHCSHYIALKAETVSSSLNAKIPRCSDLSLTENLRHPSTFHRCSSVPEIIKVLFLISLYM